MKALAEQTRCTGIFHAVHLHMARYPMCRLSRTLCPIFLSAHPHEQATAQQVPSHLMRTLCTSLQGLYRPQDAMCTSAVHRGHHAPQRYCLPPSGPAAVLRCPPERRIYRYGCKGCCYGWVSPQCPVVCAAAAFVKSSTQW